MPEPLQIESSTLSDATDGPHESRIPGRPEATVQRTCKPDPHAGKTRLLSLLVMLAPLFPMSAQTAARAASALSLTYVGTLPEAPLPVPWKLTFASATEGWAFQTEFLFATNDGGKTWRRLTWPVTRQSEGYHPLIFGALLTPSRRGWIGINPDLFRTDDAGASWTKLVLPHPDNTGSWSLDGWSFLDDGHHGWVVMRQPGGSPAVPGSPQTLKMLCASIEPRTEGIPGCPRSCRRVQFPRWTGSRAFIFGTRTQARGLQTSRSKSLSTVERHGVMPSLPRNVTEGPPMTSTPTSWMLTSSTKARAGLFQEMAICFRPRMGEDVGANVWAQTKFGLAAAVARFVCNIRCTSVRWTRDGLSLDLPILGSS